MSFPEIKRAKAEYVRRRSLWFSPKDIKEERLSRSKHYRALFELNNEVLSWFDKVYPDDVFTGESKDYGAVLVTNLRLSLKEANKELLRQAEADEK